MPTDVEVEGPDGKTYEFPDGTDKAAAIKYFKAKGIGVSKEAAASPANSKDTAVPEDFMGRVGARIKSNIKTPVDEFIKGTAPGGEISNFLKHPAATSTTTAPDKSSAEYKKTHPFGDSMLGNVAAGALSGPIIAYRAVAPVVQSWWKDPANLAGDVMTGMITAGMEGKPVAEPRVAPESSHPQISPPPVPTPDTGVTPEQWSKHIDTVNKAYHEHAEAVADYANKEAKRRSQWAQKAYNAKKSAADHVAATSKRDILDRGSREYAELAQTNIRDVHQTVRARLDSRWNQFRQDMAGTTVNSIKIGEAIRDARSKLKGSPTDLKQFNDLIKESGVSVNDAGEIEVKEGKPSEIPLDTARVHSSAIGDKLAAGDLPGNVYQALKTAKEGIEGTIEEAADQHGQGDAYRDLKRDWSQYMQDWNDMRSVAGGKGSVLARALRVPGVKFLRPLMVGNGGDLLLETLGKYRDAGANPELVSNARKLARQAKSVEVPKVRETPPGYDPGPAPRLKDVPLPKPEPPKPGKSAAPKWARVAGKIGGKMVGSTVGSVVGHPFIGYAAGGEAGAAVVDELYKPKLGQGQGRGQGQGQGQGAVPPQFIPPR